MIKKIRTVEGWREGLLGNRHENILGVDVIIRDLGYIGLCIYYNRKYTLKISTSHYV